MFLEIRERLVRKIWFGRWKNIFCGSWYGSLTNQEWLRISLLLHLRITDPVCRFEVSRCLNISFACDVGGSKQFSRTPEGISISTSFEMLLLLICPKQREYCNHIPWIIHPLLHPKGTNIVFHFSLLRNRCTVLYVRASLQWSVAQLPLQFRAWISQLVF